MISFFKNLHPLNVLWLAVVLIVLRIKYLFSAGVAVYPVLNEPFKGIWEALGCQSISPASSILLAGLIVFAQAMLINYLVNHFNLLGKPTFLPALMYITVSGLLTPFLVLSPPLICNFLVIWMLFKLFSFYKSKDSKTLSFDLGMIVAVGSLIYLPFIFLFLTIWIGLMIFKPFDWREWVACIVGYITILFFTAVHYYLHNNLAQFTTIWLPLNTRFPAKININHYNYLVLIPAAVIFALCIVKLQQNFFKSYVQVRKSFQLLFFVFLVAGLSVFVEAAYQIPHFILCTVPAAIFFSYYFLYARVKLFYEVLFGLLLVAIVYFQFNTF